ncbi:MAG: hypothetical protein ACRDOX_09165, partial [Nocardioides sp.]
MVLLGAVQPAQRCVVADLVGVHRQVAQLCAGQECADLVVAKRASWVGPTGAAHQPQRVGVEEALVAGPGQRRTQDTE